MVSYERRYNKVILFNKNGFTLIEIGLVMLIIGLILAVILPRAHRAEIEAKYELTRQNCVELARYGNEWAEYQQETQGESESESETPTAVRKNYLDSLSNGTAGAWVADTASSNWADNNVPVEGRKDSLDPDTDQPPSTSVKERFPPETALRNPFNGTALFLETNLPSGDRPVPGAVACASQPLDPADTDGLHYYALIFQGVNSGSTDLTDDENTFYPGQGATTLEGLRNGIFMATAAPPPKPEE